MAENPYRELPKQMFISIMDFEKDEPIFNVAHTRHELVEKDSAFTYVGVYKLESIEKLTLETRKLNGRK